MNHAREEISCDRASAMALTGRGVGVAVLDTGIYPHEDFENRIIAGLFADSRRMQGKK